jgi:hypothetical protein
MAFQISESKEVYRGVLLPDIRVTNNSLIGVEKMETK